MSALRAWLRLFIVWLLCWVGGFVALVRMLYCVCTNPHKAWMIAIAFDRLMNAAANGDPDETISSRADRAQKEGRTWGCVLCRILDWIDPGHCEDSAGT